MLVIGASRTWVKEFFGLPHAFARGFVAQYEAVHNIACKFFPGNIGK